MLARNSAAERSGKTERDRFSMRRSGAVSSPNTGRNRLGSGRVDPVSLERPLRRTPRLRRRSSGARARGRRRRSRPRRSGPRRHAPVVADLVHVQVGRLVAGVVRPAAPVKVQALASNRQGCDSKWVYCCEDSLESRPQLVTAADRITAESPPIVVHESIRVARDRPSTSWACIALPAVLDAVAWPGWRPAAGWKPPAPAPRRRRTPPPRPRARTRNRRRPAVAELGHEQPRPRVLLAILPRRPRARGGQRPRSATASTPPNTTSEPRRPSSFSSSKLARRSRPSGPGNAERDRFSTRRSGAVSSPNNRSKSPRFSAMYPFSPRRHRLRRTPRLRRRSSGARARGRHPRSRPRRSGRRRSISPSSPISNTCRYVVSLPASSDQRLQYRFRRSPRTASVRHSKRVYCSKDAFESGPQLRHVRSIGSPLSRRRSSYTNRSE